MNHRVNHWHGVTPIRKVCLKLHQDPLMLDMASRNRKDFYFGIRLFLEEWCALWSCRDQMEIIEIIMDLQDLFQFHYPLVNFYITMENHHRLMNKNINNWLFRLGHGFNSYVTVITRGCLWRLWSTFPWSAPQAVRFAPAQRLVAGNNIIAGFRNINLEYSHQIWPEKWNSTSILGSWRSPIDLSTSLVVGNDWVVFPVPPRNLGGCSIVTIKLQRCTVTQFNSWNVTT